MSGLPHFVPPKHLAAIGLCLFLSATKLWSEPISVGLAIEDTVVIYADSSVASPPIAALLFAHHILVLGEGDGIANTFDKNGWTQVETADSLKGWVRSEAVAVAAKLHRAWSTSDTLYEAPDKEASFHVSERPRDLHDIRLRQIVGSQTWLGAYQRREQNILWLPADDYQYEDIYIALSYRYRGSSYDVGIRPLHPEKYREIERDPLKSLQVALRLQEIALPHDTLYTYGAEVIDRSNASALAADLVHHAYISLGQYEKAIDALQSIVAGKPTDRLWGNPAAPTAALDVGDIYRDHLKDLDRALQSYHFIIREYPGVTIGGSEWNYWIDIRAAERILDLLADSPERLGEESLEIVAASPDSVVQMVGQRGQLRSMGLLGFYQTMVDSALHIVEESPSNSRTYFRSHRDFSTLLISEVLTILADNGEFDLFYEAAAKFAHRFADYDVGTFALSYPAQIADRTHADLDVVIRRYWAASDLSHLWVYDPWKDLYDQSSFVNRRIAEIREFAPYQSETILPNVELKVGFEDRYPVLDTLSLGTSLTVLYSNRPLILTSFRDIVGIKVRLEDGRVGWLDSDQIKPREEPPTLDAAHPEPPSWNMHLANAQNNPVFTGPVIERPTITRILPDLNTKDLRFYDVNGDLHQDLIVNLNDRVLALDGTTLDSLFSFGWAEAVVLGRDRLFLKGRNFLKGRDSLYCYDFLKGNFTWSRGEDNYFAREPIFHAGRFYDIIRNTEAEARSSKVICLDAATGEVLWEQDPGLRPPKYSFAFDMVINDIAVIVSVEAESNLFDIAALDPLTGRILWKRERSFRSPSMSIDENNLYGYIGTGVFGAIDLTTGEPTWSFSYPRGNSRTKANLIVLPDKVVASGPHSGLMALTKAEGLLIWAKPSIGRIYTMTAVGNALYVGHEGGARHLLTALSLDTGATHWQLPLTKWYSPRSIVYQSGRLLLDSAYGIAVIADSVSFAEGGFQEPPRARLAQNYPNPFNAETTIPYNLSRDQHVELVIYNILGQQVRRLVGEIQPPGLYQAAWDGTDSRSKPVSSGVYLYRLRIGNWTQSKRMVILK